MPNKNFKEIPAGTKYGRLTVSEDLGMMIKEGTKTKKHYARCICDCGNEVIVDVNGLKMGKTQSCGCKYRDGNRIGTKKFNDYTIYNDIVFVKFTNRNQYFICDLEDWEKLKKYCWFDDGSGYAITSNENRVHLNGESRFHRIVTNCPIDMIPDHIHPVSSGVCDNRKSNLEIKTPRGNALNRGMFSHNTSGYKGVYKKENKYEASIKVYGQYIYLGRYNDINDAIRAREDAEEKYFGESRRKI